MAYECRIDPEFGKSLRDQRFKVEPPFQTKSVCRLATRGEHFHRGAVPGRVQGHPVRLDGSR